MKISKVITSQTRPSFSSEDLKKLTDFFSILIKIDQRQKTEQKQSANGAKIPRKEVFYG